MLGRVLFMDFKVKRPWAERECTRMSGWRRIGLRFGASGGTCARSAIVMRHTGIHVRCVIAEIRRVKFGGSGTSLAGALLGH